MPLKKLVNHPLCVNGHGEETDIGAFLLGCSKAALSDMLAHIFDGMEVRTLDEVREIMRPTLVTRGDPEPMSRVRSNRRFRAKRLAEREAAAARLRAEEDRRS